MKYSDFTAIILCAGNGSRANLGFNKAFFTLDNGKTVIDTVLNAFNEFENVILVYNKNDEEKIKNYACKKVLGGATRGESVKNALTLVTTPYVIIHDGARPFVKGEVIDECVETARKNGSAISCVKAVNSLKRKDGDKATSVNREEYFEVQTPQAFITKNLKIAYDKIGTACSDDSEVYEKAGNNVCLSNGDYANKKLTNYSDFNAQNFRVGYGFDVHALSKTRQLVIGGIKIGHYMGLLGHSDADVLTHAIMDALLSGAGKKDIGCLFPDTDKQYENADSIELLKRVVQEIKPYKIVNVSAVIMAQKPKMAPHIDSMRNRLSLALGIDFEDINISATTTEKLGICGEEKGIASSATVLLTKI